MSKLSLMVTITNRSTRQKLREYFRDKEQPVVFETLGRGTAASEVLDYFGLEASEKIISFSVVTDEKWKQLRRGLITQLQIDIPGRGIAFTIPLSSIGGKKVLQYLIQEQEYEKEEETSLKETIFELLIIIANQGSIDTVMDAARSAKAGGGTVIHAKGTGMETAKKFLGVSVAEEKEMIFIVTHTNEKNAIMKAVMEQAGLDSKERAIVFSLPVTSVAGLRILEEELGE